jgi:hypothetical protein
MHKNGLKATDRQTKPKLLHRNTDGHALAMGAAECGSGAENAMANRSLWQWPE